MMIVLDLARGTIVTEMRAANCSGKSADAVILKHCSAPPVAKWKKGMQVYFGII